MVRAVRGTMDVLYWICAVLGCAALVLISAVIPWAVFTRYVLDSAASWPEPFAVLLTIVLTFFGAAACYRRGTHMSIVAFTGMLPETLRPLVDVVAQALVGVFGLFMAYYGAKLVTVTWYNTIPEFPALSVGLTYLPIPLGGAILFLFAIERITIGRPDSAKAPEPERAAAFE
jgi:TRAP-type C4-dicarboxylate transport system permease small subunit